MGTEEDTPEMVKIDVKVTKKQKQEIDRVWKERGYPNRSEFIRDVLRDAIMPSLTPEALQKLAQGFEDINDGRVVDLEEAKEELDVAE